MGKVAGVDGCRGGWVVVKGDGWPPSSPLEVQACETFREVLEVTSDCEAIAIDIPIGLPDSKPASAGAMGTLIGRWPRVCDLRAQELLGGKGKSRLFLAPPRAALSAENPARFQTLHRSATGMKASLPVWGILPRIREVDEGMTPSLQDRVFEFYPELVWMHLAETQKPWGSSSDSILWGSSVGGEQPLLLKGTLPSKHTAEGIEARLRVLGTSGLPIDLHWLTIWKKRLTVRSKATRANVKFDDLLDAMAGLKAAMDFLKYRATCKDQLASDDQGPLENQLASLKPAWERSAFLFPSLSRLGGHPSRIPRLPPTEPPLDSKGLRMEIWY